MAEKRIPTEDELKAFALAFERNIVAPLTEKGFRRYNVFDILNIHRQELRHSDFLAFLLDPKRNGGIGDRFLRKFLLSEEIVGNFDFSEILYGAIENITVGREIATADGRIDILLEFTLHGAKKQRYVVAIENKTDSAEHDNQLSRYGEFLAQGRYGAGKKILLYLTIDREMPKDAAWIAIDYKTVCDALEQTDLGNTDKTVALLIDDYKEILKREFIMEITELKNLARKIYAENKPVFDFIYESLPDWTEIAAPIVHTFLQDKGFELQSEQQKVNIVFRKKDKNLDERYRFQINLRDLSLYFMDKNNGWKNVCKQKWLVTDRKQSLETAEHYAQLAITEPGKLAEECRAMLALAFEDDKIISECIASIESYEKKLSENI